ncbi:MAG: S49 family peptidase, partial [Pseudonocardiaceae bacterium]
LGLIDRLGTMRGEIERRYPTAEITVIEGRRPLLARLGLRPVALSSAGYAGPDSVLAVLESLEHRAAWSRFGL